MVPSLDMRNATAPSPEFRSASPLGAPCRLSLAITSTCPAVPADTESRAAFIPAVPALSTPVMSAEKMSLLRSRALAIIAAHCFSAYGGVVVAKIMPSTLCLSVPCRQSSPAATPMVMLSSSKLAMDRSDFEFQPVVSPPSRCRGT